jgi:predicted enzyme related to lactoylglutathione lyase
MENQKHPTLSNGKICYLQIPAKDIAASSSFYKNVFGWAIRQRKDGSIAFDDTVNEVSGTWVTHLSPAAQGLLVYIMVDNVDETVKAIITCGGRIVQEVGMDAPEITARFADPAGNVLGIFQQ